MLKNILPLLISLHSLTPSNALSSTDPKNFTLKAPSQPPKSAPVPHNFVGLGIEGVLLPEYAGNKSYPNTFFSNLVSTIANRSGADVLLRVGGTTLDHAIYNASQPTPYKDVIDPKNPAGVQSIIGPSWFDAFETMQQLPLKYVYQIPLTVGSIQNTVTFAKLGLDAIGTEKLEAIEIGNEPNLGHWDTPEAYVDSWLQSAKAVEGNLTGLPKGPIFQGLALASVTKPGWNVPTIFKDGIDQLNNIKSVSHHFYEIYPNRDPNHPIKSTPHYLQSTLLNHTYTKNSLSDLKAATTFLSNSNSNSKNKPNTNTTIPFLLGEIGSGLAGSNANNTMNKQLLSSLGTAIWTLDFHLYCMSIGIAGVSNQVGEGYWNFAPFAAGSTSNAPTGVHPTWYGIVAAAEFLGNGTVGKERRIVEVEVEQEGLVAYASWVGERLDGIAVLNLRLWEPVVGSAGEREEVEIRVSGLPGGSESVEVKRLTGPGGLALGNVTWGGERWSFQSGGKPVLEGEGVQTLRVRNGSVDVRVGATEAVVLKVLDG